MILNFWLDNLTAEETNSKYFFFQHIKEDLTFSFPKHLNFFFSPSPPSPPSPITQRSALIRVQVPRPVGIE